ncbi:MAG: AI-2E family transporter [Elusimicrobiota bacterium]
MDSNKTTWNREWIARIFFFSTFLFLLYQVFLLAKPFIPSVLIASLLVTMFYPLYMKIKKWVPNKNMASLLTTLCVILAALLPLAGFIYILIRESSKIMPLVQNMINIINSGDTSAFQERMPAFLSNKFIFLSEKLSQININLTDLALDNARELVMKISAIGGFIAKNIFFTIIKFLIVIICLFFMFRDGENLFRWILNLIPMENNHKNALAKTALETFWAVNTGVFVTAAAQGFVAMIGFLIAGTKIPVLLGLITGFISLLGASFLITFPAAFFMWMTSPGWGLFLLLWGAIPVGWLDNFLKPVLIGSRTRMPFILVFFSILGGIKMYGFVGLILGPMLVACVLTFIKIYKEAYSS